MAIVKAWSACEPSAEVTDTYTPSLHDALPIFSEPSRTVITPLSASIWNAPPALSVSEYVTVLVVASASKACAVTPTKVPAAAFSSTALVAALQIDADSGVITVLDGSLINREADASLDVTVRATS